jgi:TFIIF-interacting CTD phosphatase-like protein
MITAHPSRVKYATNVVRLNKRSKSSRECVLSGTIPNTAISTAPVETKRVPRTMYFENKSPRINLAKNAFHNNDTAPSGARITTGSEAIWKREPRMLEEMNMPSTI